MPAWVILTGLMQYLIWVNLSTEFVDQLFADDKLSVRKRDTHDDRNYTATPVRLEEVVNEVKSQYTLENSFVCQFIACTTHYTSPNTVEQCYSV